MELNKIYNEDCLMTMRKMPDEFIDLVVTSPPYDNLREYNGFNLDVHSVANQLFRVVKMGGVIVWIVSDATVDGSETLTSFKQAITFREAGFNLLDTMIWIKDGGGAVGSNYCYTQNFEYMFVFTKGKPLHINLLKDKPNLSYGVVRKDKIGRRNKKGEWKEYEQGKVVIGKEYSKRNNWWKIVPQKQEGSDFHPAVFPEILVGDHIRSWSNYGDLVYDPFMGSGTTAKVCHILKRNWIGSEISKEYFEKANERIYKETQQLTLF